MISGKLLKEQSVDLCLGHFIACMNVYSPLTKPTYVVDFILASDFKI